MVSEPSAVDASKVSPERLIFVSDASAEAERLTSALRAQGYSVFDVPLGLLVSRIAVQKPNLVICDVDAHGALATIQSLRDVPGAHGIDVLFVGVADGALETQRDQLAREASATFVRPIEPYALLKKVEALIGAPPSESARNSIIPGRSHRPPGLVAATRRPYLYDGTQGERDNGNPGSLPPESSPAPGSDRLGTRAEQVVSSFRKSAVLTPLKESGSIPPAALAAPRAPSSTLPPVVVEERALTPLPSSEGLPFMAVSSTSADWNTASNALDADLHLRFDPDKHPLLKHVPQSEMSPQLQKLLNQAELRVSLTPLSQVPPPLARLTPEEEVDAILPADVLAALDEPLGFEEHLDLERPSQPTRGTPSGSDHGPGRDLTTASPTSSRLANATRPPTGSGTGGDFTRPEVHVPKHLTRAQDTEPPDTPPAVPRRSSLSEPTDAQRLGASFSPFPSRPAIRTPIPSGPIPGSLFTLDKEELGTGFERGEPLLDGALLQAGRSGFSEPVRELERERSVEPPVARAPEVERDRTPPPTPRPERASQIAPGTIPAPPRLRFMPSNKPESEVTAPVIPASLRGGDAITALSTVIRERYSGALTVETTAGIRRVVLRDGDFVTVASGIDKDSLVAYLTERGDISPETATSLGRRLPPYGRHAGAALIAQGHLRQDELWSVLRAHAEWLLGKVVATEEGAASLEEVPERLSAEPAVFGGATGSEVFVEIVRRVVPAELALTRLGGRGRRLLDGRAPQLLGECALRENEVQLVHEAITASVGELLERTAAADFVAALYALVDLGVLQATESKLTSGALTKQTAPQDVLDDAALRARIKTRRALVDEGDYFSVLGLGRLATSYDVRRAYLELRRSFDPHVLTSSTAELRDDLDTILEVLDEAYEILKDPIRSQRYLRALEAKP